MELISIRQAINLFSVSTPCTSTQWERLKGPTSWSPHRREEQIYDPWVACLNRASSALQSTITEPSTTQTLCFILAPWDKREEDKRGGRQVPKVPMVNRQKNRWQGSLTEPTVIIYSNNRTTFNIFWRSGIIESNCHYNFRVLLWYC